MRPILPSDLDLLTRVMMTLPAGSRSGRMTDFLRRADVADRYRKRLGKLHPEHGDGSLHALALQHSPSMKRSNCDTDYLAALACVVTAITQWRGRAANHHVP